MNKEKHPDVQVRVIVDDGKSQWVEEATGRSARQAVWWARDKYRGKATVHPEDPAHK